MQFPSTCIIVPVYNEYKRLNIHAYNSFLHSNDNISIVFVNDASTDKTIELLQNIQNTFPSKVKILSLASHSGKAEAIRAGMLSSIEKKQSEYYGFIDADLAVPLEDMLIFAKRLYINKLSMALGIRTESNKLNIYRTTIRKFLGNVFRLYLHNVLNFNISDSQCGAKVFTPELIPVLYKDRFKTRWLADIELLIRYGHYFKIERRVIHDHIAQIPVSRFSDIANSKFNIRESIRIIKEIFIITTYVN